MSRAEAAGSEKPTLSVVIVGWNSASELPACLDALAASVKDLPFGVTVVDNASHDGTAEATERSFPGVHVIRNATNVGFARACNQGIRQSHAEYVLLLNPDCRVVGDACERMAAYLASHPEAGAVGPRIQDNDSADDLHSPRLLPTLWSDFCDRSGLADRFPRSRFAARHHLPEWDRTSAGSVECLSGACMMLRRSALAQVGLLDEGFFLFGEDVDLCLRVRQAGWQVCYLGTALVVHRGGASTSQARDQAALYAVASRQRFFRKHRGAFYALLHRLINATLAAARVVIVAPLAVASPSQRARLRRQWRLLRWCLVGGQIAATT
jgi:N-acetylglucosaminyl-diphospho-decaprenol L-rhamnosyltransferase